MKVSVAMITYNHERFIAQALESALMQRTGFDYEIVVGDDCSSDRTPDVITQYAARHPGIIRPILNRSNLGMHRNSLQVLSACTGRYIAILEGDDHWTSPFKLKRQADYLDANSGCALCFHNVMIEYADASREPTRYCPPDQPAVSTGHDLIGRGNFIPACSKMFRREHLETPEWISTLKMGDWPGDILLSRHGTIGYIDEIMGTYLIHPGGAWYALRQDRVASCTAHIEMFEALAAHTGDTFRDAINAQLHDRYLTLAEEYAGSGDMSLSRRYAFRSLKSKRIDLRLVKAILRSCLPQLFMTARAMKRIATPLHRRISSAPPPAVQRHGEVRTAVGA